jgi:hypothetical protein
MFEHILAFSLQRGPRVPAGEVAVFENAEIRKSINEVVDGAPLPASRRLTSAVESLSRMPRCSRSISPSGQ